MSKKPTLVCDVETYQNYFLVGFRRVDNDVTRYFELCQERGVFLNRGDLRIVMESYRIVTFNGRTYDLPMIVAALTGCSNWKLKEISDMIIQRNIRWWDLERELKIIVPPEWDHIDLSEPAPGVMIPLKLYGARMHSRRLQDLPVDPDAHLDDDQIEKLRDYNLNNDLPMTIDLWNALQGDIELREHMTDQYGIDMRSKSGAQIAEAIIKSEVRKVLGRPVDPPVIDMDRKLKYQPPSFLEFKTQQLRDLFKSICETEFEIANSGAAELPATLTNTKVKIGGSSYKLGIGGLHSNEKSQSLYVGDNHEIHDDDVASFYPSIILQCNLFPPNMGPVFLTVFRKLFDSRISAKRRAGELKAEIAKIEARIRELEDEDQKAVPQTRAAG